MACLLSLGQWQGFFQYGPEYGEIVSGKEAEFRLFIEGLSDDQFEGRIIDWEGMGVNGEVSTVKGFIQDHFISFIKHYPVSLVIDEWGSGYIMEGDTEGHKVYYEGAFDPKQDCFAGTWEIVTETEDHPDFTKEEVATGTWRMYRS